MTVVVQKNDGKVVAQYRDVATASSLTGADKSHIYKVTNGKRQSAAGSSWEKSNTALTTTTRLSRAVAGIKQIDKSGEVVAIYASVEAAARFNTKATAKQIQKVLEGRGASAGGYRWSA